MKEFDSYWYYSEPLRRAHVDLPSYVDTVDLILPGSRFQVRVCADISCITHIALALLLFFGQVLACFNMFCSYLGGFEHLLGGGEANT